MKFIFYRTRFRAKTKQWFKVILMKRTLILFMNVSKTFITYRLIKNTDYNADYKNYKKFFYMTCAHVALNWVKTSFLMSLDWMNLQNMITYETFETYLKKIPYLNRIIDLFENLIQRLVYKYSTFTEKANSYIILSRYA